jgi:multidrug efflux pump
MLRLIDFFFSKKRFTVFVAIMLLIFGMKSYQMIAKEGAPQIKVPYIFVSIFAEGFSPKDSEKMILKPLEKELSKIQGIKNITAYSYINNASVVVEFDPGVDIAAAMSDVRDKTAIAKAEFPKEIEEPVISEVDLSAMPVLNVALLADNLSSVMPIARDLQDEIESIADILKVEIKGEQVEAIEIRVLPETLKQFGISIDDILKIQNNNKLISSGFMRSESGEFSVNVPSLIKNINDIKELPIKTKNGIVIKLQDVATIVKTHKEQASIARINGKKAVVLEVSKRSGANIIQTIKQVHEKVDTYAGSLGGDIEILYMRDTSNKIKDSLSNLQNEIIFASIIVLLLVMQIVGFRQAILISISLPLSFFISIWILHLLGISLNIVVLFGLVLSIGMIVDASSIVVEYASQQIKYGMKVGEAYSTAVRRMYIPAIVSTVTVLIVSAPLLAFPGIIGGFMKYLPLTLIVVLSSSLFVALFIMPTLGALFDKPVKEHEQEIVIEDLSIKKLLQLKGVTGFYARLLFKTIKRPFVSLFWLCFIMFAIIVMYIFFNKGVEFFPNIETNYIRGYVRGVGNISLEEKEKAMNSVTQKVIKEIGDEVDVYYTFAGSTGGNSENIPKDAIGVVDIQLVDWQIRRSASKIIQHLRDTVHEDGFIINFDKEKDGPPQSTDIYYEVFGSTLEEIESAVLQMKEYLDLQYSLQNVETTKAPPKIEYQIIVDKPLAMKYGVDSAAIAGYVKLSTNGVLIDKYSPDYLTEKSEIILRYPSNERNISQILNSFVIKENQSIPIANFIKILKNDELVEIIRKNGKPMLALKANIKDSYINNDGTTISMIKSEEKAKIFKHLESIAFKNGVSLYAGGTDEDQKETMQFLQMAFSVALIVIFLVFLVEFNSFGYALIIMSSVFLSIIGVLLGLVISQNPLGIVMCGIGIIALAGIVVSNNLIYLDFFQTFKRKGTVATQEALIKAAILRAKPIILTSMTNVVGLLPAMFGVGIDFSNGVLTMNSPTAQWWIQLSSAIAGGLMFSTLLTLFFTPSKVLLYLKLKGYAKKDFHRSTVFSVVTIAGRLFKKK